MIFNILLWLIPFIVVVITVVSFWDMAYDAVERFMAVLAGLGFGALTWLICLGIYALFAYVVLPRELTFKRRELVTIQDVRASEGIFFLGTGSVEGVPKYSFYQSEGGASLLRQVDADGVKVYQDSDKPYVLVETGCNGNWQWLAECGYDGDAVHEIHVPKGTIKNNLVLDAQ